jgi:maltooligosyltrehalose trehalohydrolase
LNWQESTEGDHARLLELYRELARLRRAIPELSDPRFARLAASFDDDARWFRLDRGGVTIIANFGAASVDLAVGGETLLSTDPATVVHRESMSLTGHSAVILRRS